ncbi:MAG: ankyrin repeat domain-containing protein [Opitutaceae bacterium]|jgi:hypothetical protein
MKKNTLLIITATLAMLMSGCASSLRIAAQNGDTEEVRRLLAKGADINTTFRVGNGGTALIEAADHGHAETVRLLLEKGADINAKGCYHEETALMRAAFEGRTECVKLLLDRGADIEARSASGLTALDVARTPEIVMLIKTAVQARLARIVAEEKRRIEEQFKDESLARLLEKNDFANVAYVEALTTKLIEAKNRELAAFVAKSTVGQRVALLTTVEKRLLDAQTSIIGLNGQAEDAIRRNSDAASYRQHVGKLQAYQGVLKAIQELLNQS